MQKSKSNSSLLEPEEFKGKQKFASLFMNVNQKLREIIGEMSGQKD